MTRTIEPPETRKPSYLDLSNFESGFQVEQVIRESIDRLGAAETKNVQQIAASQLELLSAYHQVALAQSARSFLWAVVGSGVGLLLFIVSVTSALIHGSDLRSIVPLIAGAIVEIVSSVVFYLYGKTSSQLSAFHSRLEVVQRYLLANSICESLSDSARDSARMLLIQDISRGQTEISRISSSDKKKHPTSE